MPGLRILVLDGGGARGLFTIEVLRALEASCGRPIRECFDLLVGTSIGGFIAGCLVAGHTIDELETEFTPMVTSLANAAVTPRSIVSRLLWGHVLDPDAFESRLYTLFGTQTLQDLPSSPRLLMIAADARTVTPHPFLIRTRALPETVAARSRFEGSATMRLTDAFRAVTAAPTIFPAHVVDGIPLVDGGILANNPVLFALAESALLGPSIGCVVSIGTGTEVRTMHPSPHRGVLAWVWAAIKRSVDPETPDMLAEGLLSPSQYVRFDPPNAGHCSTWESDPATLDGWRCGVQEYLETQQDVLASLVPRLCGENPPDQDNGALQNSGGS
jgi:predicted acylesterase/phospholipase RssA